MTKNTGLLLSLSKKKKRSTLIPKNGNLRKKTAKNCIIKLLFKSCKVQHNPLGDAKQVLERVQFLYFSSSVFKYFCSNVFWDKNFQLEFRTRRSDLKGLAKGMEDEEKQTDRKRKVKVKEKKTKNEKKRKKKKSRNILKRENNKYENNNE